jgi:hypothetical protein
MIHKALYKVWVEKFLFTSALVINTVNAFIHTSTGIHILAFIATIIVLAFLWNLTISEEKQR